MYKQVPYKLRVLNALKLIVCLILILSCYHSFVYFQATALNCTHSFCALCIRQWLAVKKECPNCRTAVTSQMRSIVLDNYIDRMVEQLSAEMKDRRKQLVAERKGIKVFRNVFFVFLSLKQMH